jgi:hypothetical protein
MFLLLLTNVNVSQDVLTHCRWREVSPLNLILPTGLELGEQGRQWITLTTVKIFRHCVLMPYCRAIALLELSSLKLFIKVGL